MKSRFLLPLILVNAIPLGLSQNIPQNTIWHDENFNAFRRGSFGDGGANTYVSRAGRIQTINRFDLNNDSFMELVFNNSHGIAEKLDGQIYWGNGRDFDAVRSDPVPNNGAQWMVAGDLNRDGNTDLVVANYQNGTYDAMDSAVYWGRPNKANSSQPTDWSSYPFGSRTLLPTRAAQKAAIGDLNRDGFPDIVFALSAGHWEYRSNMFAANESPSVIYWGARDGFSKTRKAEVPTVGAADVAVGDLNKDGWPDLVFANREDNGKFDIDSYVYYGSSEGYSPKRRIGLPGNQTHAVSISDVNGDGLSDILLANSRGNVSFIYLNTADGFDPKRRVELESSDARGIAADDLDHDGYVDVFITNHQRSGNRMTDSYLYFGSASGFTNSRRKTFPSIGAWGVAIADLNADGWKEVVIANFQDFDTFDTPSYIYWNSKDGFSPNRRTPLMTSGAVGVTVADFNMDANPDILICSTTSGARGSDPVYVYWGNQAGDYTPSNRLELPAREAYESAAADLDDDGHVDLLVANMGETIRRQNELFIWRGGTGSIPFSRQRLSTLAIQSCMGVSVADFDRDGYLDIVMSNFDSVGDEGEGSYVYWGGKGGYAVTDRTRLFTDGARAAAIADLNGDGNLEIIFGSDKTKRGAMIFWGDGTRNYGNSRRTVVDGTDQTSSSEVADLNKDGFLDLILPRSRQNGSRQVKTVILWGNPKAEYSLKRSTLLSTEGTSNVAVADVNKDGWLDIVAPSYSTGTSRSTLSSIFWGGSSGFSETRKQQLPTNSAAGAIVSDFNHDGFHDVLFYCHRNEPDPNRVESFGSHHTPSFLYMGGPDGLSVKRRREIPGIGPHNDFGVDPGNISDRSSEFDYVSAPRACPGKPTRLSWKAITPRGTAVKFQLRVAETEERLSKTDWGGPDGPNSFYQSETRSPLPVGKWMQYRAVLFTAQGANSPILERVEIEFQ